MAAKTLPSLSSRIGQTKLSEPSAPKTYAQASRSLTSWTGFTKTSNLIYFSVTAGVFSIFCAFNFVSSLPQGHSMKPNPPGESFWFRDGLLYWGMQIHLWTVLPAGILLPLQFLPGMRRRYMHLHKLSGRLLFVLLLIGDITALSIARVSFGGSIDTQVATVFLSSITSFSIYKAWTSIRSLRIDQHRAWVIRTWTYAGVILSLRLFMIIIAIAANRISPGGYRYISNCEEIIFMYNSVSNATSVGSLFSRYPDCADYDKPSMGSVHVIVNASLSRFYPEERAALMNMVFGVSGWAGMVVNILLTEVYLNYTKDEEERLKKVSMARRKAAGLEKVTYVAE